MKRPQQDIPDYPLRSKPSQDWYLIKAVLSSPKKQEEKKHTCKLNTFYNEMLHMNIQNFHQTILSIFYQFYDKLKP